MAADKDAAKRRRQARNRQERLKRQQRTQSVQRTSTSRPSRKAEPAPSRRRSAAAGRVSDSTAGDEPTPAAAGGFLGKLFPPRPQAGGGRPSRAQPARTSEVVEVGEVEGIRGQILRLTAQPGGRATVLAALVAVVCVVTLLAFPVAPRLVLEGYGARVVTASHDDDEVIAGRLDRFGDADPVIETDYLINAFPPVLVAFCLVVPVLLAGLALHSLTRPTRSRTLLITAMGGAMYVFLTGQVGIYFLLGALALGFAAYQSRKADTVAATATEE